MGEVTVWSPLACIKNPQIELNVALVILNSSLSETQDKLKSLWKTARFHICADGGANKLYQTCGADKSFTPEYIAGDLDSVYKDVLLHYEKSGSKIAKFNDQNSTDFEKCLKLISKHEKLTAEQFDVIYVLGSHGGRLDQSLAILNTLYKHTKTNETPLFLIAQDTLTFILPPGRHKIYVNTGLEGSFCGLIPLGESCRCISTTGLAYNLSKHHLMFGSQISSNNSFDGSDFVTVDTSDYILWTMSTL